jgi:hypothetical protein
MPFGTTASPNGGKESNERLLSIVRGTEGKITGDHQESVVRFFSKKKIYIIYIYIYKAITMTMIVNIKPCSVTQF